jgi:antitoxin ParD1/3/4
MPTATATQEFTVTLPKDVVEIIRSKVSSGEYASESAFIEDAIVEMAIFADQDPSGFERWIATEGVRRYDAMKADPSRGLTTEQVFANLDIEIEDLSEAG